ncbi:MAG: alpha/beta hydrolase [Betaproteobacteria bacterium]|nr:alpha/beta hydrolase [Betaproteobacteria bacterium]
MKLSRPHLVFSHANGFPAPCYAKLFAGLESDFEIHALPRLGHHPDYPVHDGWPELQRQLIDFVAQGPHPVIAVGHSLGGFLSFMAAVARPELFSALILLDAPIIGPLKARGLAMSKYFGFIDRVTPARATLQRRQHWASEAEAVAHFRTRKLFRYFDAGCLEDYARHGTVEDAESGGRVLWFDPRVEYQVYCTFPHHLHHLLHDLRVPAGFIGGRDSVEVRRIGISAMRGRFRMKRVEGGHLFPFEHPQKTAQAIRDMAAALLAEVPSISDSRGG